MCTHAKRSRAFFRPCSLCQISVDYGNTKLIQHALKAKVFSMLKMDMIRKKTRRWMSPYPFRKQVAHWMFAHLNFLLYSILLLALCDATFWGQNRMVADPTWLRLRPELGLGLGTDCYFYCISCSFVNRLTDTSSTASSVNLCSFEKEFETPQKFHLWIWISYKSYSGVWTRVC